MEHVTFSGNYAKRKGQRVMYITERAVFELGKNGVALIEAAPGIDVEKDILAHMSFTPFISGDLKKMVLEEEKSRMVCA